MNSIRKQFEEAQTVLETFIKNEENFSKIEQAGMLMCSAINAGCKINNYTVLHCN